MLFGFEDISDFCIMLACARFVQQSYNFFTCVHMHICVCGMWYGTWMWVCMCPCIYIWRPDHDSGCFLRHSSPIDLRQAFLEPLLAASARLPSQWTLQIPLSPGWDTGMHNYAQLLKRMPFLRLEYNHSSSHFSSLQTHSLTNMAAYAQLFPCGLAIPCRSSCFQSKCRSAPSNLLSPNPLINFF